MNNLSNDCHAQRRPERQPRRHILDTARRSISHRQTLNEGRSVNPGRHAQQSSSSSRTGSATSLNEGRSVNPGDTQRVEQIAQGVLPTAALNEGRSVNPGDTNAELR